MKSNVLNPIKIRVMPASFEQEILLASEIVGIRPPVHLPLGLRINDSRDITEIKGAVRALARRQAVLRTSVKRHSDVSNVEWQAGLRAFASNGLLRPSLFQQQIRDEIDIEFDCHRTTEEELLKDLSGILNRPFTIAERAPWRCAVVITPRRRLLFVALHQSICDSCTLRVFQEDLAQILAIAEDARHALSFQYHDYAAWQVHQLGTKYFEPSLTYWRKYWEIFDEDAG